jgi:GNAT superfamily N-acetyltransferase
MQIVQIPSHEKNHFFLGEFEAEWRLVDQRHFGQAIERWEKETITLLAQDDESVEVHGYLDLTLEMGVAYIDTLIVKDSLRGQGIGRSLVQAAEDLARQRGLHKIYLTTGRDWDERKFYEAVGYTKTADLPHHFLDVPAVHMSKFLEKPNA